MNTNQYLKMAHPGNFYSNVAKTGPPNLIRYGNSMTAATKKTDSRTEQYPWIMMP